MKPHGLLFSHNGRRIGEPIVGTDFFGALLRGFVGERPYDKDVAARSAKFVNDLAAMPWDGFGPGSDAGAPTKAKPEIWKDKAKFDKLGKDLQVETAKLASAGGGGLDALKGAVGATGKACSNCHDDFRAK